MPATPTPANPWIVNPDGTVDVLVWQGRVWLAAITHPGLTDPTGYSARVAFAAKPGATPLAAGSTLDGGITLTALPDDAGTRIDIALPDERTDAVTVRRGVWDLLLEGPDGTEYPVLAGTFTTRLKVAS